MRAEACNVPGPLRRSAPVGRPPVELNAKMKKLTWLAALGAVFAATALAGGRQLPQDSSWILVARSAAGDLYLLSRADVVVDGPVNQVVAWMRHGLPAVTQVGIVRGVSDKLMRARFDCGKTRLRVEELIYLDVTGKILLEDSTRGGFEDASSNPGLKALSDYACGELRTAARN